jgi:hypothetical protein
MKRGNPQNHPQSAIKIGKIKKEVNRKNKIIAKISKKIKIQKNKTIEPIIRGTQYSENRC